MRLGFSPALLGPLALLGLLSGCSLLGRGGPTLPERPLLAPDPRLLGSASVEVTRRGDGTVLVAGEPFFPLGFYYLPWAPGGTAAQRGSDLQQLARGGFNLMATEPANDQDVAQYATFLDQAQRSGVFVLTYGLPAETVAQVGHHPAVLGFKISDDSNAQLTPAQVQARNLSTKRLSPDKLTYISLAVAEGRPETGYFGTADMVGNQSYPVGNDDISVTYRMMRSAVQSAQARRSVPVANLQTFSWGRGKPAPTVAELRNMSYQALMAGVRGLIYYAYRSREVNLSRNPQLWAGAQSVAREVAQVVPALLDSGRTELSDGRGGRPLVVRFAGEGGSYLMALNNSRTQRQKVDLSLGAEPELWLPLDRQSGGLTLSGSRVVGDLAPLQVAVYHLDRPAAP